MNQCPAGTLIDSGNKFHRVCFWQIARPCSACSRLKFLESSQQFGERGGLLLGEERVRHRIQLPLEPSVTLYCPIEGGTYVIDATVQELARRTDSDVLILDALDILAGEWGPFGKGMHPFVLKQ